ncbi:hypothetical protein KR200_004434 [Drosophila serrata]|nr:hypothetical protein KR200_004434 [Drosophila serrata]
MEVLVAAWSLLLVQPFLWNGMIAGQGYLDGEQHRPLWILDDGLTKRQRQDRPEADYATTTRSPPFMRRQARGGQEPGPITFLVRHEEGNIEREPPPAARRRMPSLPQRRFMMPHRLQLPHQYVQPSQRIRSSSNSRSSHRRTGGRHLPVFDNAPGENTLQSGQRDNYPIFVYNGTRGELILNTMLSRRRYPMQEPVPGQVLYPPSTPMFRPKPIVERFRLPGQREMLNLTLIPFYAHEAISNPSSVATQAPSTTQASPTPPPLPAYETQLPRSQEPLGKRKRKKAKQYEAFHSPQEVMQWQSVLRRHTHEQDRDNHRHYSSEERQPHQEQEHEELLLDEEEEDHEEHEEEAALVTGQDWVTEQETETEVELPPEPEPETTSISPSSVPFQIVYLDDSLERPVTSSSSTITTITTTDPPPTLRQSSRYALKREYYAFPVYTLGKLLQPQAKKVLEKSDRAARSSSERGPSTWFILNSRWVEPAPSRSFELTHNLYSNFSYKGPLHHRASVGSDNQTKYYTSKYMESSGFRPRR